MPDFQPFLPTDNAVAGPILGVAPHAAAAVRHNRIVAEAIIASHVSPSVLLRRCDVFVFLRSYVANRFRAHELPSEPHGVGADDLLRLDELAIRLFIALLPDALRTRNVDNMLNMDIALLLDAVAVFGASNGDAMAAAFSAFTLLDDDAHARWSNEMSSAFRILSSFIRDEVPRAAIDAARLLEDSDDLSDESDILMRIEGLVSEVTDALVGTAQLVTLCPLAAYIMTSHNTAVDGTTLLGQDTLLSSIVATYEVTLPALVSLLRAANLAVRPLTHQSLPDAPVHVRWRGVVIDGLTTLQQRTVQAAAHSCLAIAHALLHFVYLTHLDVQWPGAPGGSLSIASPSSTITGHVAVRVGEKNSISHVADSLLTVVEKLSSFASENVLATALASLVVTRESPVRINSAASHMQAPSRTLPDALRAPQPRPGTFFADLARVFDLYRRFARLRVARVAKEEAEEALRVSMGRPLPPASRGRQRGSVIAAVGLDDSAIARLLQYIVVAGCSASASASAVSDVEGSATRDDDAIASLYREQISSIRDVLPEVNIDKALQALKDTGGDVELALDQLMNDSAAGVRDVSSSTRSIAASSAVSNDRSELRARTLELAAMQEERDAAMLAVEQELSVLRFSDVNDTVGDHRSRKEAADDMNRALAAARVRIGNTGAVAFGDRRHYGRPGSVSTSGHRLGDRARPGAIIVDEDLGCVVQQKAAQYGDDGDLNYNDEKDDAYDENEKLPVDDTGHMEDEGVAVGETSPNNVTEPDVGRTSEPLVRNIRGGSSIRARGRGRGRGGVQGGVQGGVRGGERSKRDSGRGASESEPVQLSGSAPTPSNAVTGHGDRARGGYSEVQAARKGEHKASVGNHSRKRGADRKLAKGMY